MNDFESDSYLKPNFKQKVDEAVSKGSTINFITYVLGDSGEAKLKYIFLRVLEKCSKIELMELLYTSAKELIVNSTKAAIKRLVFEENNLGVGEDEKYEKLMAQFKENLTDKKFPFYKGKMKQKGLFVSVKISYNSNRILLKIINNFPLLPQEEKRIREKFINAKQFDNLFEFYLAHSDNTEGAGMGITLVEIMLVQSGYDRHLFTISSNQRTSETIAKVEIPLNTTYKPFRVVYQEKINEGKRREDILKDIYL
jgi:hypothetical protein